MMRPVRTGFAWERDTSAPFIDIRWDYRRGATIDARLAVTRLAVIIVSAVLWAVIVAGLGRCGSLA